MSTLALGPANVASAIIALSFAAGLNVYATVLSLGVMARLHWIVLPPGLEALANNWILGASAVLFAGEFVADKIPGIDVIWSALHTFVRVPIAALMAYQASSHLTPGSQIVVTCLGAVVAAIAHGSKTAIRLAVTPSPEPFSNIALSTGEDGMAIGLTWFALHHPLAAGAVVSVLLTLCVAIGWLSFRSIRTGWQRLRHKQQANAIVRLR